MKIGILTFHCAANYGALLQAYALQETLIELGHETYILDYRPSYLIEPYRPLMPGWNKNIKKILSSLIKAYIKIRRNREMMNFSSSYLNILPLKKIHSLDAIVVGSDQIWNPDITGGNFDDFYFINLPLEKKVKRIAYAASAGGCDSFNKQLDSSGISRLLEFDSISVREKCLFDTLNRHAINCQLVLDPVLLANQIIFDKLADKSLVPDKPYFLTFSLWHMPWLHQYIKLFDKNENTTIIDVVAMDEIILDNKIIQHASMKKLISLIKYAKGVISTSFHGTALSIIFKKDFLSVGFSEAHGARALSLLESLGMSSHYHLADTNMSPELCTRIQNPQHIDSILSKLQKKSRSFLIQSLDIKHS